VESGLDIANHAAFAQARLGCLGLEALAFATVLAFALIVRSLAVGGALAAIDVVAVNLVVSSDSGP
jgi:hypothetical protein